MMLSPIFLLELERRLLAIETTNLIGNVCKEIIDAEKEKGTIFPDGKIYYLDF